MSRKPWRKRSKKNKIIIILAFVVPLLILVIALLAWGIAKSKSKPAVAVLIPLYVYPFEGAWDPLYSAADNNTNLQFVVVINPNSGPGNGSSSPDFERELPKLNSRPNIKTIGYVRTGWAARNITDVLDEVSTYAAWNASLRVNGIFFDEVPNNYTDTIGEYMNSIDQFVKAQSGFNGVNFVVHNPGTIPGDSHLFTGADVIVVFEKPYDEYSSDALSLQKLSSNSTNGYTRNNYSYMINTLPTSWTSSQLQNLVNGIDNGAKYLFLTDRNITIEDVYSEFGTNWGDFIKAMSSA